MKSSLQSSPFLATPVLVTLISLFASGCPSSSPSPHPDAGTPDAPVGAGGITGAGGVAKTDAMGGIDTGMGAGGTGGNGGTTSAGGRAGAIGAGGAKGIDAATGGNGGGGGAAVDASGAAKDSGAGIDASSPTVTPVPLLYQAGPDFTLDPFAIAMDDDYIYWTSNDNYSYVMRIAKAGGAPEVVYATGTNQLGSILVDATSVYFEQSTCCPVANSVLKVPKGGSVDAGTALLLAQTSSPTGLGDIAIDSTNLYYPDGGGIYSVPLAGGTPKTVVDTKGTSAVDPVLGTAIGFPGVNGLISDGTNLYYTVGQTYGGAIAVGSPLAYSGWLLSVPVGGGVPTVLVPNKVIDTNGDTYVDFDNVYPWVHDGFVYWRDHFSGNVYRESVQGGTPNLLASGAHNGGGTAISDGTNVYYILDGLIKVPVTGGDPVVWVYDGRYLGAPAPYGFGTDRRSLLVDETSVYAIAYYGHGIVKIAK